MPALAIPQTPGRELDAWILAQRGPRNAVNPRRPYAFFVEPERTSSDAVVQVATVFLANRECPWRCLMCDLWKNTLPERVDAGAIPDQIHFALSELGEAATHAPQIKLYNSGSFFDAAAIPPDDYPAIADQLRRFERVIVESHPALIGERCLRFRDLLGAAQLEIAMGLESAHPTTLERLNKRVTLEDFAKSSAVLRREGIALRVFVLVKAPWQDDTAALEWAQRSVDFAFACGAAVTAVIPTRAGNGALEALAANGQFAEPSLALLESTAEYGVALQRGRVFADLWDLERFSRCAACFQARRERLVTLNLTQRIPPRVPCSHCSGR